ncbi:hypothetical protein ACFE04_008407 [Oxalis oulophora]
MSSPLNETVSNSSTIVRTTPPPPPLSTSVNNSNNNTTTNTNTTTSLAPAIHSGGRVLSTEALAGLVTGLVLGAVLVMVCVCIFVCFYKRNKRKKQVGTLGDANGGPPPPPSSEKDRLPPPDYIVNITSNPDPKPPHQKPGPPLYDPTVPSIRDSLSSEKQLTLSPSLGVAQIAFTYEELAAATDCLAEANIVGQGGFGYVYRGVLPSGRAVAIKQLKVGSGQGQREFQAEVEIISRVHHKHLVSLVGYCIAGTQRLLVYEFIPNNTLEVHLHEEGRFLSWPVRMTIALGSAKGIAYLHEECHPKIIHRDIKASNILLDDSFDPKVADFGLAKLSLDSETHVSTRVMGTFGYLAPEYAASGKLTEKSDVFSFGVVLLELITGRRPVDKTQSFLDDDSIVDWAKPLLRQALEDGNFDPFVDPSLQRNYDPDEMTRVVACAVASVRHSGRRRPRMSQIVRALEGNMDLEDLNEGLKPGYSAKFSSGGGSTDYSSAQYKEDMEKFRKLAFESQQLGSSDGSVPTSEYAVNPSSSSTECQQTTREMDK